MYDIVRDLIEKEKPKFDGASLRIESLKPLFDPILNEHYQKVQEELLISNEKLLYHGAPIANIESIITNGFDINKVGSGMDGLIGKGIYLSDLLEQSIYYCLKEQYLGNEKDFYLLVCKVELGHCVKLEVSRSTVNCEKYEGFDSHYAPYSQGNKHGNEYCIFNTKRILPLFLVHLTTKDR